MDILKQIFNFALTLATLWVFWKVAKIFFHYFAAYKSTKDLVYIKVMLPREDTHKDREEEVQKDFREKIGVMSQLYRSLHEIRELDFKNRLKVWLFQLDIVSFELVCENKTVGFHVTTYKNYQELVEKQITSYYPDAHIDVHEKVKLTEKGKYTRGFYAFLRKDNWFPIQMYKEIENDPLNSLTNVMSKLEEDEMAMIQVMIRPSSSKWQKKARAFATGFFKTGKRKKGFLSKIPIIGWFNELLITVVFGYDSVVGRESNAPGASGGDSFIRMLQTEEEVAKNIGVKAEQVGFDAVIRIFAKTSSKARTTEILNNMFVAFNAFKDAASNWFQMRRIVPFDPINNWIMKHNFENRYFRFGEKKSILVPDELANIIHFPSSIYNFTPIIEWLKYKVLPAPLDTPAEGLYLGNNLYRGAVTKVHFKRDDRTKHHYIIGKSGTGKSNLISFLARQDIANGEGVCVVDPHGDLVEDILAYIPKERAKDVIVFDPSDLERPMGLNILEARTPEEQDMVSSQATEIFIKLFGDEIFGPRIQHYFRNACLTLMDDPDEGATLIDVPRMFTDDAFMQYKLKKVKNPVVKSFWQHEYANTGQRERQEMIPYFSAKFGPFITNTVMRNTIGQTKSAFDLRKVMDEGKVLLINLSKGKIGDLNTQLLGLILVSKIQMAAMSRADMPKKDRKDFYLYVDEFQNFATDSFATILSEARKYRLNLIMAHQYINQLVSTKYGSTSSAIRDAVFGNVGTMMSFKVGAEDAEYLAKEYSPTLSEQDIINIANYKTYIKLNIDNTTSRPFSLETIYDTSGKSQKIADIIKEYSRMKYGRKKEFVEQEVGARIGFDF